MLTVSDGAPEAVIVRYLDDGGDPGAEQTMCDIGHRQLVVQNYEHGNAAAPYPVRCGLVGLQARDALSREAIHTCNLVLKSSVIRKTGRLIEGLGTRCLHAPQFDRTMRHVAQRAKRASLPSPKLCQVGAVPRSLLGVEACNVAAQP